MSDHVDGDTPVLARDAAGETRLTDAEAVALAEEWGKGATLRVRVGSWADPQDVAELKALVRYAMAVAPVVAAARKQAEAAAADAIAGRDGTTRHPQYEAWIAATDATEVAVRALDGDA